MTKFTELINKIEHVYTTIVSNIRGSRTLQWRLINLAMVILAAMRYFGNKQDVREREYARQRISCYVVLGDELVETKYCPHLLKNRSLLDRLELD